MSLFDVIGNGEGKTTEFIKGMPSELQIAEVAIAFSNRAGGMIVIGVTDNGEIVGVEKDSIDSIIDTISVLIHDLVTPMILPEIYLNRINNKTVIVVKILPGASTPYYMKSYGKIKGTFIRVGKTNIQADEEKIKELERQRLNISFDEDTSWEASELEIKELYNLLSIHMKKEIDKEQLYNLKLIKMYGEIEYFTNAALIILGKLVNSGIRCAKFKDETDNVLLFKKDIHGNIFEQLENAVSFIKDLEIPIIAVREIIVNALIHRDYAITGSEIRIAVYESRIEIISPGDLPKTITIDDILSRSGKSETRNKIVARIIKDCGYMDQWGSGINRAIGLCDDAGLQEPIINEEGIFIRVLFFRYLSKEPRKTKAVRSIGYKSFKPKKLKIKKKELTKSEIELIKNILIDNPSATSNNISEELQISIASIKRRIKKLQKEGIIQRIGPNKGGHWQVNL